MDAAPKIYADGQHDAISRKIAKWIHQAACAESDIESTLLHVKPSPVGY